MVTAANSIEIYSDALVVLGTAGVVVPILRRWGVSPIIGYLGAGAVLGPLGLGSFMKEFPFLYWFTIVDAQNVSGIAELGVVFLLFLIGLELSFRRLVTMRRLAFGLGGLQILITASLLAGAFAVAGLTAVASIIVGASLALSSTAFVIELLANQGRLTTTTGRASFSVLLAQDLLVVPILVFISVVPVGADGSVVNSLFTAFVKATVAIGLIVLFGRMLLRPLFGVVATTRSTELFVAAVLFVVIGAGLVAHQAGLSMALGAFVIALMLAETEYGKAIQTAIEPLKGLLLGAFFFTVGTNIDFREFVREPIWLLAGVVCLITLKALIVAGLGRAFRLSWPAAIGTGLLLGPGGEFAFVSIGMAAGLGVIEVRVARFALAVTAVTMALTPLLSVVERRFAAARSLQPPHIAPELAIRPPGSERHAIVVGYGRVGKVVCSLLEQHGVKYVAIDHDASGVARDRHQGYSVYYGDATDARFLEICGLMEATGVIITINSEKAIDAVVKRVREVRPEVLIVSRARDEEHARHLYAIGATDAVPETIEASLQLSEAALVGMGVATGLAIASIHEKRDEFRHALQRAAKEAGRDKVHSLRSKGGASS
jgi:monovalent cation:H+ antiporter-2, CPA2 family